MATKDFLKLIDATYCPFARTAKIWFGPNWDPTHDFDANLDSLACDLTQFANLALTHRYHGYIAEICRGDATTLTGVCAAFREALYALAKRDESCRAAMSGDFLSKDWQFAFADVRHFLNVFAPCYTPPHSKYVAISDRFFVFFQPEFAFDFCGVNPRKVTTKERIRAEFASHEMPYPGALIDARIEALLYVFPQRLEDEPVRWWED